MKRLQILLFCLVVQCLRLYALEHALRPLRSRLGRRSALTSGATATAVPSSSASSPSASSSSTTSTSTSAVLRSSSSGSSASLKARRRIRHSSSSTALHMAFSAGGFEAMDAFSVAFVGGTTGVLGVMFALELQKVTYDENLEACPYCMGNGEILCACCMGNGACTPGGSYCTVEGNCAVCLGRGLIQCLNCKGDGRLTPLLLQSKASRDPEYAVDEMSPAAP